MIDHVEKISLARKCSFVAAATDIFSAKVSGTFKRLLPFPFLLIVLKHHNFTANHVIFLSDDPYRIFFILLSFCSRSDKWLLAA